MDTNSAEKVIETSIRAMALFTQLVRELKANLPDSEFVDQRRAIGEIMGNICCLIGPAAAVCPHLDLDSNDGWKAAGRLSEPQWLKDVVPAPDPDAP